MIDRKEWEHFVPDIKEHLSDGSIVLIFLAQNGDLKLTKNLGGYRTTTVISPDTPVYYAWQEVLEMKPGEIRDINPYVYEPPETYITPENLFNFIFELDYIERIEVLSNGSIKLVDRKREDDQERAMEFPYGGPHFALIEKHFGPLTPGLKVEIPPKHNRDR